MANLRACKRAGFRVLPADGGSTLSCWSPVPAILSWRSRNAERPYAHAMTGHNLILRDASPPIADAPPSHVRAVRAGVRATSNKHHVPMQTEQRQPGRVRQRPKSPKAIRSPLPSPPYRRTPSATGGLPEPNSCARLARSGARPQKSGSRHKPPPARRNGQECEKLQKVPRRCGAARKDKLLESPNFLCGLAVFHLVAGQPCFMEWQNRETARPGIEPEET